MREGLYRSYVEREENSALVRGRIVFWDNIRQNYVRRDRTYCRYADLTWDIPENQLIRQVAHMLSGWDFGTKLRARLYRLDVSMFEVSPTVFAPTVVERFRYHRLNEDYRQLHHLCRLFLEGASLSEDLGTFNFRTFLLDMNSLFEIFITRVLGAGAGPRAEIDPQRGLHLDYERNVDIRPDILVRSTGRVVAVADCKYKRTASDEYKHHDIYQLLAYCIAAETGRGILIYPRHINDVDDVIRVANTSVEIRRLTVDLGKEWVDLQAELERFTRSLLDWSLRSGESIRPNAAALPVPFS